MTDGTSPDLEGLSAESRASLLSRLCFWWGIPVLRSFDNDVRKGCFTFDSLPRIPAREGARRACVEFDQVLAEELKRQRPSFHRAVVALLERALHVCHCRSPAVYYYDTKNVRM